MFDLERDIYGGHWNYVFSRLTDDITNEGWQDHATPKTVCDSMIDNYQYKQTDKILVLFNAELINALHAKYADEIIYSNIYYIADTEKKNNYIKKYLPKINCKYLNKEDWSLDKLIETIKEFNMPKHFDVIFTNPPYENKDLQLIDSIIKNDLTDKMIVVHPGTFLFGHKESAKFKFITDVKHSKMLKEVTFFWGNEMFDKTGVKHAHCISVWDKTHNSNEVLVHDRAFTERNEIYNSEDFTYTINIDDITLHSKVATKAAEFLHKFMNLEDNLNDHQTNHKDLKKDGWTKKFGFKLSSVRGGLDYTRTKDKKDENNEKVSPRNYNEYFSFFGCEDSLDNAFIDDTFEYNGKYDYTLLLFYFDTEAERTNFVNYLKLKCTRFLLSLVKNRKQLVDTYNPFFTSVIPWMDFTKHYSEEDLKKAWGIDEELWNYIDKFFDGYYEDYKEIAK